MTRIPLPTMVVEREVALLLGGDEGQPVLTFSEAETAIAAQIGPIVARSRDHWTEAWGFESDEPFLNKVLLVRTALAPDAIMAKALTIEERAGRIRVPGAPYGPRTLDIDVLFLGEDEPGTERVVVPHPRLHERSFALAPLADVRPTWRHPQQGLTVLAMLDTLRRTTDAR